MFGELPKLFDKNFAIGYFLPVVVFYSVGLLIADQYNVLEVSNFARQDILLGTTIIGLISWLTGILLVVTNRDLYRFLEGYGKYNPLKLLGWMENRRYDAMLNELKAMDAEYLECLESGREFSPENRARRNALLQELSVRFPDDKRWFLPTAFGNTLRSFEVYPRIMYGIEGVDGWSRLVTVIPEKYLALVDDAKSQVDFWVNLGALSMLLLIEYIIFAVWHRTAGGYWLLLLILALIGTAPYRARRVAVEWGEMIKSAFDVYRFDLLEALHLESPATREKERELWLRYSQSIVYRLPSQLPRLRKSKKGSPSKN